ncbi:MAG: lysophospholipid acyltransferase family protein [Gemmataceae bacterium]
MKIRDPRLIAAAGWLGTRVFRLLSRSLRFEHHCVGGVPVDPLQPPEREPFIYALWHENFLIPIIRFANPGVSALVSRHADGQLLGTLIHTTGMRIVHGSTSRGGVAAVRELMRPGTGHLAVTPDGPRGPRRVVQPGVVYLASRTGLRIVPIGVGHRRPWRMNSWDSFAVPRPLSRVRCIFGRPFLVPPNLHAEDLAPHVRHVQDELDTLTAAAQDWADTGHLVVPPTILQARASLVEQPNRLIEVAGAKREAVG